MQCALSGQVPEQPVVSKVSGHVFEKRLVTKYIDSEGKDPVTGDELSLEDLVDVKVEKNYVPRAVEAASIPGMLALLQNEWDEVMIECAEIKRHLDQTRQELSQALYQNDAACRVIARVVQERDDARAELVAQRAAFKQAQDAADANAAAAAAKAAAAAAAAPAPAAAMDVEEGEEAAAPAAAPSPATGIKDEVLLRMTDKWKALSKKRKKRTISAQLLDADTINAWREISKASLHRTSPMGITCLSLSTVDPDLVLTGGLDKNLIIYNRATREQLSILQGHSKKIHDVCFHPTKPSLLVSCSADKTTRVWKRQEVMADGNKPVYKTLHTLDHLFGEVVGVAIHATGDFLASADSTQAWAFHDLIKGSLLRKVEKPEGATVGYSSIKFHPDGLILATGTADSVVRIWDMKSQNNVANFEGHTSGAVNAIAFSENGYYMASAGDDGCARLWDLRKLKEFHKLELGGKVASVAFDYSASYMAVGGDGKAKVYAVKEWQELSSMTGFKKVVTGVQFGPDAKYLGTSCMDRTLRFYALDNN